jgi:hypothetical protein
MTRAIGEKSSLKDEANLGVILGRWAENQFWKLLLGQAEESGAIKVGNFIKGRRPDNLAIFFLFLNPDFPRL